MVFADVLCLRRRRRGDWRVKQQDVAVKRERRPQSTSSGGSTMPLPVTEDTPPDMLAGAMDIKVLLPSGRTVNMSVERSTQMMDLLVQLTTTYKLSLAAHTTVALSDSGYPLHHLPSTPLGALDTRLIHIAQRTNTLKRAPLRPNNAQPFTTTFRLQVHLPRNQLFVTRVSPDTRLADVLGLACSEKNLDPDKYELRHPANLCERLSLSHTLADYRLQEVTLVACRPPGAPLTPADIMALQREEEKRRQQVKKTGGIYSIIFNKRSKGVPEGSGSVSSDSLNGRSISPARSDESTERSVSPPEPAPPPRPGRKRRPAPKPPASAPAVGESVAPVPVGPLDRLSAVVTREPRVSEVDDKESATTLSHSRTSSDSSGYHEASVLSESPDTRTNSTAETLPRRSKLPTANPVVSKNKSSTLQHATSNGGSHNLSRSLSNLTAVGVTVQNMHSASTSSLASQGLGPRKKKAAPRPPTAVQQPQHKAEVSKPTTFNITTLAEEDPSPTSLSQDSLASKPKLQAIVDEEDIPVAKITTTAPLRGVDPPTSFEEQNDIRDPVPSKVEHQEPPVASPDLVTSAIIHSPPDEEDDLPPVLEAASRSEEVEDVPEWQYHLPAPPSAFRDLHSPTTTEFETVVLADADVFREVAGANKRAAHHVENARNSHETVREEDLTSVESTYNESSVCNSLQNDQSLPPSKDQDRVIVSTEVMHEADKSWAPQTIAVAEKETKSNLKFNNGDLRLRSDGVDKEVYKVNPIFDATHFEEDHSKSRVVSTEYPQEENHSVRNINMPNRRSSPDLQSSNQLKNFTISTYNKPKNVDSIFREDKSPPEAVFKKPFVPPKHIIVARNNSFTTTDQDRPVSMIKRSTSHVSLARPYAKPTGFQSMNRTKSISNLVVDEEGIARSLRKTTSEANLNQGEDAPLQSLQVLKSILPRLSQSQVLFERNETQNSTGQSQESYQQSCQAQPTHNTNVQLQDSYHQLGHPQPTKEENFQLHKDRENSVPEPDPGRQPPPDTGEVRAPSSEPRPFVYRGPPAVNFSTWSERPKIQVSLKSDRDYKMGKQQANTSHKTVPQVSGESSVPLTPRAKDTERRVRPERTEEEVSAKIEPIPLTMRIVSHTAPSNHRSSSSLFENTSSPKTDPREDRLPIVRAVELKKNVVTDNSVPLRNMSSTHLNGPNTNNVAHVPVNYHQGSLYNRYSYVEPSSTKPLGSTPSTTKSLIKSVSTTHLDSDVADVGASPSRKYTSVVGINGSGEGQSSSSNVARFQTSAAKSDRFSSTRPTVKVNGFGVAKPMPTVKGFRFAGTEAANYDRGLGKTDVRVESGRGTESGVPDDRSHSFKQPLKTINGIENSKQKFQSTRPPSAGKAQHSSSTVDIVEGRTESRVPLPPKPPTTVFRSQSSSSLQRPMSMNANPRDQLMEAIKSFGGRDSLKPAKAESNVVLII